VWYAIEIVMLKTGNGLVGDSHAVGADLLIITNHDHLLGYVEQEKALNA
jgi:hypothetical protein